MLHQSRHLRVELVDGVATLWLEFPGTPVNSLTPMRLRELDAAIDAVVRSPWVEVLVLRSGRPAGFCGGADLELLTSLATDSEAATYARIGQDVLNRLASLPGVTLAFLEGPCLGPGLELALACDYRLLVTGPDSCLGFPEAALGLGPHWGGSTRLSSRQRNRLDTGIPLDPREAQQLGLVDDTFCRRRAKIELRGWLDRIQARPRKRITTLPRHDESLAVERQRFRRALRSWEVRARLLQAQEVRTIPASWGEPVNPRPPLPETIGIVGRGDLAMTLAREAVLRGSRVILPLGETPSLEEAIAAGRATPLEAEHAGSRIQMGSLTTAGFVVCTGESGYDGMTLERSLPGRTILAVPAESLQQPWSRPDRVIGIVWSACSASGLGRTARRASGPPSIQLIPGKATSVDTAHTAASWLARFVSVVPTARQSLTTRFPQPRSSLVPAA